MWQPSDNKDSPAFTLTLSKYSTTARSLDFNQQEGVDGQLASTSRSRENLLVLYFAWNGILSPDSSPRRKSKVGCFASRETNKMNLETGKKTSK